MKYWIVAALAVVDYALALGALSKATGIDDAFGEFWILIPMFTGAIAGSIAVNWAMWKTYR